MIVTTPKKHIEKIKDFEGEDIKIIATYCDGFTSITLVKFRVNGVNRYKLIRIWGELDEPLELSVDVSI